MKLTTLLAFSFFGWCTAAQGDPTCLPQAGDPPHARAGSESDAEQRALLVEAEEALARSDYDAGRAKVVQALTSLLARADDERDETWLDLLDSSGHLAWRAADPAAARQAWEGVLEALSRTLPEEHLDLQGTRQNLASTLRILGDFHGARALEEQVLEVTSRTLPEDHEFIQQARQNLALTLKTLGELHEARALEEQVLEVRSRTLPEDDPHLQATRADLAVTLHSLGDIEDARGLFQQVLEVLSRTLPEDHRALQTARQNLAATIADLGDLRGALALEEEVLEVLSRTLPEDDPGLQGARQNLAATLFALGDYQAARGGFERVLEVLSRTFPENHPDLQLVRGNLALSIEALGDLQGARALKEQVLEIRSRTLPDDHPDLQTARGHLAVTIKALGDLEGARELEEQVLEILSRTLPEQHSELQAARANLAVTIKELGDLEGARALEELVLEVWSRTLPDDHPALHVARGNLALTLRVQGDLEGARALDEQVLEARSRTLSGDHPDLQSARLNLAATIAAQLARLAHGEGGEEGAQAKQNEWRERCVSLVGAICRSQARAAREAILSSSSREAQERCARLATSLDGGLSFAHGYGALEPLRELLSDAFVLSESTRGAALTSATLMRQAAGQAGYEELRHALREQSEELAALAQRGTASVEFQDALAGRDATERELLALGRELLGCHGGGLELDAAKLAAILETGQAAVAYRRYTRWTLTLALDAGGVARAAPLETALDSLCAFVVRPGEAGSGAGEDRLVLVDLGPIEPIDAAVEEWRASLGLESGRGIGMEPRSQTTTLAERGEALRALVFDPLLPALGAARHVKLVLDDVLHLVPFDALPATLSGSDGGAPHELLGQRFRFEVRNTLGELLERVAPSTGGALVALGGTSFDEEPLDFSAEEVLLAQALPETRDAPLVLRGAAWERRFRPLAHTGPEARDIAALHERAPDPTDAWVLEGRRASRESLEALAPQARWLHVATHGWYASESIRSWKDLEPLDQHSGLGLRKSGEEQIRGMSPMLLCGLALAGANLQENAVGRRPGWMTAEELSTLDLTNCELAVLSACDTNVGHRRAGQGVASLQRALQMAGARSVITSLWKVPDEATRELMLDFYQRLWVGGKPKHQALWEAKLRLRDARDDQGDPLYTLRDWGAWVLTGEPN